MLRLIMKNITKKNYVYCAGIAFTTTTYFFIII